MKANEFRTYWIVDSEKVTSFSKVERLVASGKIAAEISAERQQKAAEEREARAKAIAAIEEKVRLAAAQAAHDRSPEGMAEQARRTAASNPGGLVTVAISAHDELDDYAPHRTNLLR